MKICMKYLKIQKVISELYQKKSDVIELKRIAKNS